MNKQETMAAILTTVEEGKIEMLESFIGVIDAIIESLKNNKGTIKRLRHVKYKYVQLIIEKVKNCINFV